MIDYSPKDMVRQAGARQARLRQAEAQHRHDAGLPMFA
jgi:hypothetical protein